MAGKPKPAMDIYDEISAQFHKIAKLVPAIEEWQHVQAVALSEAERTGEPARNVTQDHHVAAARAILNATKAMGTSVRVLNKYSIEVTHAREVHDHEALNKFFAPDRID